MYPVTLVTWARGSYHATLAVDAKIERVRDCEIMLEIGGCGGCYNFARVMGLEGLGEKVGELAGMEDEAFRKFVV